MTTLMADDFLVCGFDSSSYWGRWLRAPRDGGRPGCEMEEGGAVNLAFPPLSAASHLFNASFLKNLILFKFNFFFFVFLSFILPFPLDSFYHFRTDFCCLEG